MTTPFVLFRSVAHRLAAVALAAAALLPAQAPNGPTLPAGCEALQVAADQRVSLHAYAYGAQIWRWDAAAAKWVFVAPAAVLFASPGLGMPIGLHHAGP